MDSSSCWFHGYTNNTTAGNNGIMFGYAATSCDPAELQFREEEEEELLLSSQIQHHLNQISMRMNMDDEPVYLPSSNDTAMELKDSMVDDFHPSLHAGSCFTSSSTSSSLRSASLSCSPESSAHVLTTPAATAGCQYPEVSSHVPLAPGVPYGHGQYTNLHVPTPAVQHDTAAMAPELPATGAFKRYARHLAPRRPLKPGACGQGMFKRAMSVLAKMHMSMRYSRQYDYQEAAAAAPPPPPPSENQLQHVISERKRREKLNDSFHALKAVLPPGSKKDKTSILIRAREYVHSLESKVCELEEKNKALESRLARRAGTGAGEGNADADAGEEVEIEITRAAAAEEEPRELCTVRIAVRSACVNVTDVVLRTLQCLKDQMGDDVRLVAMSTSGGGPPEANLTLQLKSTPGVKWEEESVKEAVAKVVADALPPSQSTETSCLH